MHSVVTGTRVVPRLFVAGTSREAEARRYEAEAQRLGSLIARRGFDLVCGPGSGIAQYVLNGYRSVPNRGCVTFYLPTKKELARSGEIVRRDLADRIIYTQMDYPMRDIHQVRVCQGMFILTGGDATLQEALPALGDYAIPIAALRGSGIAVDVLEYLRDKAYPAWSNLLIVGSEVTDLLDKLAMRMSEPIGEAAKRPTVRSGAGRAV